MSANRRDTPTWVLASRPEPRKAVEVKPASTSKKVAKTAGKVALYTAANVVINPLRMATGETPMFIRPRTPMERTEPRDRNRAGRTQRHRKHVIDRHLAGKRQEPVVARKLREHQAATGSLPQWFIDGTGSTTFR